MTNELISRRQVLRGAIVAAAATQVARAPFARAASHRRPTVAVLGGGVGGLTAAHELAARGFDVTVYERRAFGGKARSMGVPGTARDGRAPLPAEHGWREVFAGYQNLCDTLGQIPFGSTTTTLDNLVSTPVVLLARDHGRQPFALPAPVDAASSGAYTPQLAVDTVLSTLQWMPPADAAHFVHRLVVFLSSGHRRRLGAWEEVSWTRFLHAERFSESYRRVFVDMGTRFASASDGSVTSARTIGKATESVLYMPLTGRGSARVFDAPTNEAWIDPWVAHLARLGVRFRLGTEVTAIRVSGGRITAADITGPDGTKTITADWYVCALPAERAARLWHDGIVALDPHLAHTARISTAWMTGVQLYLREPLPFVRGPIVCLDSPWAMAGISQSQFWANRDLARDYGDGTVREKLSMIVSDWNSAGVVYGKPARDCTTAEITHEVWEQTKRHFQYRGAPRMSDDLLVGSYLDPGIIRHNGVIVENEDPLFLPTVGSWHDRPTAHTRIPNLFLAADYVQVDFDITSMEGANEAARRAVNALLAESGSHEAPCRVFDRELPPEWATFRRIDDDRYRRGQPNLFDTEMTLGQLKTALRGVV